MEFMTADEKKQLEGKLETLRAKRPALSKRIGEARELGDLRENAEYHAAREDQGMLEAEIRRIEQKLSKAKVVSNGQIPDDVVFVGATVRLRDEDGDEDVYRLVGEASGAMDGEIVEVTVSSPMGEALMKSRVGEWIRVDAPRGTIRFEIVEIL